MEQPSSISEDTGVKIAPKHLSGDDLMLKNSKSSNGLSCGLPKAIVFGNYPIYQVTAILNSKRSKIIGLSNYPKNSSIIQSISM